VEINFQQRNRPVGFWGRRLLMDEGAAAVEEMAAAVDEGAAAVDEGAAAQ